MSTTSPTAVVLGLVLFTFVLGVAWWAARLQRRQFPKGDGTHWKDGRAGAAGWFQTKFTWLSGGRG